MKRENAILYGMSTNATFAQKAGARKLWKTWNRVCLVNILSIGSQSAFYQTILNALETRRLEIIWRTRLVAYNAVPGNLQNNFPKKKMFFQTLDSYKIWISDVYGSLTLPSVMKVANFTTENWNKTSSVYLFYRRKWWMRVYFSNLQNNSVLWKNIVKAAFLRYTITDVWVRRGTSLFIFANALRLFKVDDKGDFAMAFMYHKMWFLRLYITVKTKNLNFSVINNYL